jgi:hypothetical protein
MVMSEINRRNEEAYVTQAKGGIRRMQMILDVWKSGQEVARDAWLSEPALSGLREARSRGSLDKATSALLFDLQTTYERLSNMSLPERTAELNKE